MREMLAAVRVDRRQLVSPLFVCGGSGVRREIASMPGVARQSVDVALETVSAWSDAGLGAVLLFGVPDRKDAQGSSAWDDGGAVQELTRRIKRRWPAMIVMTDVCLCEYTDHGHCGVLSQRDAGVPPALCVPLAGSMEDAESSSPTGAGNPSLLRSVVARMPAGHEGETPSSCEMAMDVDNDATLPLLSRVAVSHARAGADVVAPSAMMDGQVAAIRAALDDVAFVQTAIMSYAVKFASCLYGPFREAVTSVPSSGDRRTYQMDPRSPRQAASEARQDIEQGADILMVKPAATYLDVIAEIRRQFDAPLAAYHVSGEYSAIKAAARLGWLDEKAAAMEVTAAIARAGADLIITYFAPQLAAWLAE